jgi:ferredoxin
MQSGKWVFVICSCDTEICVPARVFLLTGRFTYKGPEEVVHDSAECVGTEACGRCVTRCIFGANRGEPDGTVSLDIEKCGSPAV